MRDKHDICISLYYVIDTLIHVGEAQKADIIERWTLTPFHYELLKQCLKDIIELLESI